MQNLIAKLFFARNPKFELTLAAIALAAFVIGCGGGGSSAPKKPIPAAYLGTWTATDGSTISIRNDNTGDYKAGSKKVDGAAVEVDESGNEVKFTMLGVDVGKYKIDKAPSGGSMTLNGMVFKRAGGGAVNTTTSTSTTDTTTTDSTASSADVPAGGELDSLTGATMESFNTALQSDDFTDFYSQISDTWQNQITADKLQETFAPLVKAKVDLTPKTGSKPTYSPKSALNEDGSLVVNGSYQTAQGKTAQFKLTYVKEDAGWKLLGIRVNVV